ncbi:MAG: ester cyclase [Natrialbaceae archaeon]|nr:ester cyclase [Natrialbaceae archaeon]
MPSNQTILTRLYEDVWNGANPEIASEYVHEQYHIHDRALAEEHQGPNLYTELVAQTRAIFPDMAFTIEDMIAADDRVALRWTMTGTHEGPMEGIEPTGTHVEMHGIEINRFENGQLIETWTQSDELGLLEQLGAIPTDE